MTTSSQFAAGDVVQVEFPFADTESGKDRPALVIAGPSMHGDYTVSMISKQAHDDGGRYRLLDGRAKMGDFTAFDMPADVKHTPLTAGTQLNVHSSSIRFRAGSRAG